ncbi:MAG: NADH-quinone oxidoreductase subunit NuoF [Solirubrobacterales bacterium]
MSKFDHLRGVPGARNRLAAQVWEGARVEEGPAEIPELAAVAVPDRLRETIERHMTKYPDRHSAVLPALSAAQREHGWLSPEAMNQVAAVMRVTPAYLESIASFYDMLELEPVGRHTIYVCTNISCTLRGAQDLLEALSRATGSPIGGSSPDGEFRLRSFECLGACDIAPMASIEGQYRGPLRAADATVIVEHLRAGEPVEKLLEEKSSGFSLGGKTGSSESARESALLFEHNVEPELHRIDVYERLGGYRGLRKALTEMDQDSVLAQLEQSGLRGRGGAGFSMGKKAGFLPHGPMDKYLCCNADESEPGAFKDRELIHRNPHQLIEGCMIGAYAAGASRAFIYIRGEYATEADILDAALAEAEAKGYVGDGIMGSKFSCNLVVHRGAGAYICGEETALLDSLEGKRGNPRLKPPFPANQGLFQGPTLINNVETLSNTPHIVVNGAKWFREHGTEKSPGTKVVSVSGNVQRPGNFEVELGIPAREIVYGLAGGPPQGRRVKCWFPGGSSAPVLTEADLDLPYDFESMAAAGSMLGSGSIIVVDDSVPIVSVALRLARFYRHESCGKCVPCREGTNWTVKLLERIDCGEATPMDLDVMASVQGNITDHCLCVLGDSMAAPVSSMVAKFRPEFEAALTKLAPSELPVFPSKEKPAISGAS